MSKLTYLRTGDQTLVREINLSLIMRCLHQHAPISRATLAEMTGLNRSTVSRLVNELISHQFVREVGFTSARIGRPSIQLELNSHVGYIVSAEVAADFILVICTSFTSKIICEHKENIPGGIGQQAIMNRLLAVLRQAVNTGRDAYNGRGILLGIAVGFPGLLFAPNLTWRDIAVRDILRQALGDGPIFVDNEANMGALGEYFFGAARGYEDILYISAGVGLGGAIIYNGHLVMGKAGFAGEFGHMTMDIDGEPCKCGNRGCWETQVGPAAIARYARQAIDGQQDSLLRGRVLAGDLSTIRTVVEAADAHDAVALMALQKVGHYLGVGIASLVNALNPDLILLGGPLSLAGSFLLPIIHEELERRALLWNEQKIRIALTQHGLRTCVMGGVAMVYQTILAQPASIARFALQNAC